MQIEWAVIPRGDIHSSQSAIFVTMNPQGVIYLNATAWQRMGEPNAFLLMFNQRNSLIALKPTAATMKNAYPAGKTGRRNGRSVWALRLLRQYGIKLPDTIEFKDPEIDQDGQLILDLRTARVSPRAHSQCRKK